jgi:hypothetical protein
MWFVFLVAVGMGREREPLVTLNLTTAQAFGIVVVVSGITQQLQVKFLHNSARYA